MLIQDVSEEEQQLLLRNEITRSYSTESPVFIGYSVDLNEDGEAELVVTANNILYCGSGGCETWVFQRQNGGFRQLLNAFGTPYISQSKTQGYFDFVALSTQGAYQEIGEVFQWQGTAYESRDCFRRVIDPKTGAKTSRPCP